MHVCADTRMSILYDGKLCVCAETHVVNFINGKIY